MSLNDKTRASLFEVTGEESVEALVALVQAGAHLLVRDTAQHVVTVIPLTFGRARINVAKGGCYLFYDDNW